MFGANKTTATHQQKNGTSTGRSHPHLCLFGIVHLANAMKLIILVGLLIIAGLCTLAAIYLRRALTVMAIPVLVTLCTIFCLLCRADSRLLWPIIGISFFHLFLDAYVTTVFLYLFFFKPLYIIMVLNWAFDTLHTTKTLSFYVQCAAIFAFLAIFFAFNLWQLKISLRFQAYLEELGSTSSATGSTSTSMAESAQSVGTTVTNNKIGEKQNGPLQGHQCKLLNEPPIVLLGNCSGNNGVGRRSRCGHPQRDAHSVQLRVQQPPNCQFPRRSSLTERRHFGITQMDGTNY